MKLMNGCILEKTQSLSLFNKPERYDQFTPFFIAIFAPRHCSKKTVLHPLEMRDNERATKEGEII